MPDMKVSKSTPAVSINVFMSTRDGGRANDDRSGGGSGRVSGGRFDGPEGSTRLC